MRTLLTITYTIGVILLLALGTLLILTVFKVPGLELDARVVQSGSMEPAIGVGSLVFILPAEEYGVGDIITYRSSIEETPTTHRIIDREEHDGVISFTTQGDANNAPDVRSVRESEVIGSVRLVVPWIGHAIEVARQPWGFMLLIGVPALIVAVDEIRKMVRQIQVQRARRVVKATEHREETDV